MLKNKKSLNKLRLNIKLAGLKKSVLSVMSKLNIASMLIGITLGLVTGYAVFSDESSQNSVKLSENKTSSLQRGSDKKGKLSRYQKADDRVQNALKAKRLTQEQADKLSQKIKEVEENYRENIPEEESGNLRKNLREWAQKNNIPSYYILSVV